MKSSTDELRAAWQIIGRGLREYHESPVRETMDMFHVCPVETVEESINFIERTLEVEFIVGRSVLACRKELIPPSFDLSARLTPIITPENAHRVVAEPLLFQGFGTTAKQHFGCYEAEFLAFWHYAGEYRDPFCDGYGKDMILADESKALLTLDLAIAWILSAKEALASRCHTRKLHRELEYVSRCLFRFTPIQPSRSRSALFEASNNYPEISEFNDQATQSVSIVIPAYNSDKKTQLIFRKCMEINLNNPTYKSSEIILVDDGSPCPIEDFPGVHLIRLSQNSGRSAARNTGANAASNAVICFMDSDVALPSDFEFPTSVLSACEMPNRPIVFAGLSERIGSEEFLRSEWAPSAGNEVKFNDYRSFIRARNGRDFRLLEQTDNFSSLGYGRCLGDWTLPYLFATFLCLVSKELFNQVGGFNEKFRGWGAEDNHFAAMAVANGAYLAPFLNSPVYHIKHDSRDGFSETEKAHSLMRNQFLSELILDLE